MRNRAVSRLLRLQEREPPPELRERQIREHLYREGWPGTVARVPRDERKEARHETVLPTG